MGTQDFYENEFICGRTIISRGDLEGLPAPFCTKDIDDDTMQRLANLTEGSVRLRTREYTLDITEERLSEIWWEELEDSCNYLRIPYYEDMR